jgi:hypothetical protein
MRELRLKLMPHHHSVVAGPSESSLRPLGEVDGEPFRRQSPLKRALPSSRSTSTRSTPKHALPEPRGPPAESTRAKWQQLSAFYRNFAVASADPLVAPEHLRTTTSSAPASSDSLTRTPPPPEPTLAAGLYEGYVSPLEALRSSEF